MILIIKLPLHFDSDSFDIYLLDINGRIIIKQKLKSNNGIMILKNLEHFDQGVYFVKIIHIEDGKSIIKQLIKY